MSLDPSSNRPAAAPARLDAWRDWPCHLCPVRSFDVCRALDDGKLAALRGLGHRMRRRKGATLVAAGEIRGAFFKITRGIVAVSRRLTDGRRQVVAFRARGDIVGHLAESGRYAFEAETLTEVEARGFDRRPFDEMTVMGQLTSVERVASFLAGLHRLHGERQLPLRPLRLHMNRREIADYLGLSLETVSRAFSELRDRRVIAVVGRDVVILDRDQLGRIGREEESSRPSSPAP